jgi:uncharacterized protein (TIGR02145 family)
MFYSLSAFSQSYFLTFKSSGAGLDISSVKVENLSKGTSIEIPGRSVLWLTYSTGLNRGHEKMSSLKLYPNPMSENARMEFVAPVSGEAEIRIINMAGITVAHVTIFLENISHSFVISGLKRGVYVLNVKGKNYQYFEKLISNNSMPGTPSIKEMIESHGIFITQQEVRSIPWMVADTVVMEYSEGERIRFTGKSGNYRTIFMDIPESDKSIEFEFIPCIDADGNNYPVVKINNNFWMAENLKTTRYNDGTPVAYLESDALWLDIDTSYTGYYCYYNNDTLNKKKFGNLYNWVAAGFEWQKELCPVDWHVLKYSEIYDAIRLFDPSVEYLEEVLYAGGKFKETGTTYWQAPNNGATNESGFSALPGGTRGGSFSGLGKTGSWWLGYGAGFDLNYDKTSLYYWWDRYSGGHSVRCVRDIIVTSPVESVTATTAISGGKVLNDNGSPVIRRGVCWSTSEPVATGSHTSDGEGLGSFKSVISGLSSGTRYYLRAYAITEKDTLYGKMLEFRTRMAH